MADLNGQAGSPAAKPRRLLALDGGGIRGVMSLEILRKIEQDLATATGKGTSFRLGDFFDYIGGTSTGAIIAAALSAGENREELARVGAAAARTQVRDEHFPDAFNLPV
jgi:uncharacterized protein